MKIEYKMSEEDLQRILDACKPTPCIMLQCGMPRSPQKNANAAWAALGKKMGFKPSTVEPIPEKSDHFFLAEPLCLGIEIEPGVFSGCNQSAGDCPRCGK